MKVFDKRTPILAPILFFLVGGVVIYSSESFLETIGGIILVFIGISFLLARTGILLSKKGTRNFICLFFFIYFYGKTKQIATISHVVVRNVKLKMQSYSISTKTATNKVPAGAVYRLRLIFKDKSQGFKDFGSYYSLTKATQLAEEIKNELGVKIILPNSK